jgi:hypothetical protein
MSFPANTHVLPARAQIDIKTLHHLRNVGHDARRGDATEAECQFLLVSIGPLLDELIVRRNIDAGQVPLEAAVAYLTGAR